MLSRFILAAVAVGAVSLRPRSSRWAAVALAAGAVSAGLAGGAVAVATVEATAPMLVFLAVALAAAGLAERGGLSEGAAVRVASWGRGSTRRLYLLVCAVAGVLTCVVSLDGAVVLMVPLVRSLARRCRVVSAPFFLGAVAVANAASMAVPEGNPTNLVVMSRLGISPAAFVGHLFLPGLVAAVVCALLPLRRLGDRRYLVEREGGDRDARPVLVVPWRIGAQIAGLLGALGGLLPAVSLHRGGLAALLTVAGGTAVASAALNNLPVSASVAALATAGPGAYAALIGLSVGALATAHGSVATMLARDLAADDGERRWTRSWAPVVAAAIACATVLLWATA